MDFKIYEIPNDIQTAIYLLIDDEEIVYVGQTTQGLKRIFNHSNKKFNKYAFIEKDKKELIYYEDYYIMKYQPKYNNSYNCYRLSIESAYYQLSARIKKYMNIFEFADYIKSKNVKISKFKNKSTITKEDFNTIKELLEKEYGVS